MFDRQFRLYSRILRAADVIALVPALTLAYGARYYLVSFVPEELGRFFNPVLLPFSTYSIYLLLFLPVWFFILTGTQRYQDLLHQPLGRQLARLTNFFVVTGSLMGFATFSFQLEISRPIFFMFFGLTVALLPVNRVLLHWVLRSRNINEHSQIRLLIVGTGEKPIEIGRALERARKWGYHVVGYVGMRGETLEVASEKVIADIEDLPRLLQEESFADEIIFAGSPKEDLEIYEDVIRLCEVLGIKTRIAADIVPASISTVSLESLDNLPLITLSTVPEHSLSIIFKRVIDFIISSSSLIALFPIMAATGLAIKFTSPGPIFYRQVRCGLYGRKFYLTKFRTMVDGAEDKLWEIKHLNEMDGPVFKMRNDPRVTPLGKFLRKSSLDELPQLWNVLKGEMSVVGPRAPLPEEVKYYSTKQRRRLSVKPGITCLWQVSGRSEITFQRWMDMDLEYIDNWSLWLDLSIILRTIPAVFTGRGAH